MRGLIQPSSITLKTLSSKLSLSSHPGKLRTCRFMPTVGTALTAPAITYARRSRSSSERADVYIYTSSSSNHYHDNSSIPFRDFCTSHGLLRSSSSSPSSSPSHPIRHLSTSDGHRPIHLNAFDMSCIVHHTAGLWRHPQNQAHQYKSLSYWTDLAKLLEHGSFTSLFIADILGIHDVHCGNYDTAIKHAAQVPVNEPTLTVPAMAAVTKRLGFAVTISTTYELPYQLARRLSTLDHLTNGRIGWNVVTSYLSSAAVNLGLDRQIAHDERYQIADEFMHVLYKLWEGSWEDDSVVFDRQRGIYARPDKVHQINHHGKYFQVPGAHLCEPSIQRTPVIFQAGASKAGIEFASQHAEAMFLIAPTPEICQIQVHKIRSALARQGRDPYSVKIFALLTVITGDTPSEAKMKLDDYHQYTTLEGALALYGGWVGVNLPLYCESSSSSSLDSNGNGIDENTPLQHIANDNIHSLMDQWSRIPSPDGQPWTVHKIAEYISMGGAGPTVIGDGEQIADQMEEWIRTGDVDGFNLAYVITPGTFQDIVKHVVPVLRRRQRLPLSVDDMSKTTLRERLGGSSARLADNHIAASYRHMYKRNRVPVQDSENGSGVIKRNL